MLFAFGLYYLLESILKFWSLRPQIFFKYFFNTFDASLAIVLFVRIIRSQFSFCSIWVFFLVIRFFTLFIGPCMGNWVSHQSKDDISSWVQVSLWCTDSVEEKSNVMPEVQQHRSGPSYESSICSLLFVLFARCPILRTMELLWEPSVMESKTWKHLLESSSSVPFSASVTMKLRWPTSFFSVLVLRLWCSGDVALSRRDQGTNWRREGVRTKVNRRGWGRTSLLLTHSSNFTCGSYQQSNYWANNFDDFFVRILYSSSISLRYFFDDDDV